ncbi:MAG: dTDP-4-dehydrorhamnose reductase [Gammaproteobacteria bacterium]
MKILITGKNGQVGRDLTKTAPQDVEVIACDRIELDITDAGRVADIVAEHRPDVIINTAAYTAVDKAESEPEAARAVNADGAANLAEAAKAAGSTLIHLSTDFVFDGSKSSPWQPDDAVNPLGEYGRGKAEGEKRVREIAGEQAIIVRTSWVYSVGGRNFVKTMLELMGKQDILRVVSDQVGSPTWSKNLAIMLWVFVKNKVPAGIYHWSDLGVASWYDFAVAIHEEARQLGLLHDEVSILPITTADYPTPARRPPYSVLDTTANRKVWGVKAEHWRHALRRMLAELQEATKFPGE